MQAVEMICSVAHKTPNDDWQNRKRLLLILYMLLSKLKRLWNLLNKNRHKH